jgi:hypothetical protein
MTTQIVKRKVFAVPHARGTVFISARDPAEALEKAAPFTHNESFKPVDASLAWEEDHAIHTKD